MADERANTFQDPPIVITGGSVKVKFKRSSFNHEGDDSHHPHATLVSLVIDDGEPIPLKKNSRIKINYSS